jgi:hypothetical protein
LLVVGAVAERRGVAVVGMGLAKRGRQQVFVVRVAGRTIVRLLQLGAAIEGCAFQKMYRSGDSTRQTKSN